MLEDTVHESIEQIKNMGKSRHVMVKQNTMLKNRLDELNAKQEDNMKVVKIHEEINAGHKTWKKAQEDMKDERKTWKI